MDEYITIDYETISTKQKHDLIEFMNSSLLNAFSAQDYHDVMAVFKRVVDRLVNIAAEDGDTDGNA